MEIIEHPLDGNNRMSYLFSFGLQKLADTTSTYEYKKCETYEVKKRGRSQWLKI